MGHLQKRRPFFCFSLNFQRKTRHLLTWRPFFPLYAWNVNAARWKYHACNVAHYALKVPQPCFRQTKNYTVVITVKLFLSWIPLNDQSTVFLGVASNLQKKNILHGPRSSRATSLTLKLNSIILFNYQPFINMHKTIASQGVWVWYSMKSFFKFKNWKLQHYFRPEKLNT